MKSLQFGFGNHKLYGVYHTPSTINPNQKSILICSSVGPESIHPYRLLRLLGEQLAQKGHHVFRFDWYGCGDSWGESSEIRIDHWINDVRSAAEELTNLSGNQIFSIVGLRLGATIAWCSFTDSQEVSSFFLWDPVIYGADWINEMNYLHSEYLSSFPQAKHHSTDEEILGFPLPSAVKNEICALKIIGVKPPDLSRIHLLQSGDNPKCEEFCRSAGFPITKEHLDMPEVWASALLNNRIVMSHPAIKSIITFFDQVKP